MPINEMSDLSGSHVFQYMMRHCNICKSEVKQTYEAFMAGKYHCTSCIVSDGNVNSLLTTYNGSLRSKRNYNKPLPLIQDDTDSENESHGDEDGNDCDFCERIFSRADNKRRHMLVCAANPDKAKERKESDVTILGVADSGGELMFRMKWKGNQKIF